ncbi:MAG: caspase family protein, partial [Pirellulaceae bacterium]
MFIRFVVSVAIFLSNFVLTTSWAEERTNRALVVAVSDYPHLPKRYSLKGPENDARLLVETLEALDEPAKFKPEDIVVLADKVPGAPVPTLSAILGALDVLARDSRDGDFVYIHFSG